MPAFVFWPVMIALIVGAESDVCCVTLYVFESAEKGKRSKLRRFSSPLSPRSWPSRIRAAVSVETPMPSPMNSITFFALRYLYLTFFAESIIDQPSRRQSSGVSLLLTGNGGGIWPMVENVNEKITKIAAMREGLLDLIAIFYKKHAASKKHETLKFSKA